MEYLGLLFELLFFGAGLYLYLFSRGGLNSSNPDAQKKAEAFREKNALWMRLLGLALMAIMGLNLVLHIRELWG